MTHAVKRTLSMRLDSTGFVAPLRERPAPELVPAFLVPLTRQDWPVAAVADQGGAFGDFLG